MSKLSQRLQYYLRTKLTGFKHEFTPDPEYNLDVLKETKEKVKNFFHQIDQNTEEQEELLNDLFPENKLFQYLDDPFDIKKNYVGVHVNAVFNRQILVDKFDFKAPKNFKKKRRTRILPPLKYQNKLYHVAENISGHELYEILAQVQKEHELITHNIDIRKEQKDNVILSIPKELFAEVNPDYDQHINIYNRYICVPRFLKIILAGAITTESIYSDYTNPISDLDSIIQSYIPFAQDISDLNAVLSTFINTFDERQKSNSWLITPNQAHKSQINKCDRTRSSIRNLLSEKQSLACDLLGLDPESNPELMSVYLQENVINFNNWQHSNPEDFQKLVDNSPFKLPDFFDNYLYLLSEVKPSLSFHNLSQIHSQLEDESDKINNWIKEISNYLNLSKSYTQISEIMSELDYIHKISTQFNADLEAHESQTKLKSNNKLAQIQSEFLEKIESILPNWNKQFDSTLIHDIQKTNYKKVPKLVISTPTRDLSEPPNLSEFQDKLVSFFLDQVNLQNLQDVYPVLPGNYEEFQELDWVAKSTTGELSIKNFVYFYYVFFILFSQESKSNLYRQIKDNIKNQKPTQKTTQNQTPDLETKKLEVHNLQLDSNPTLNYRQIKTFLNALEAEFIPGKDGHDCYRIKINPNTNYTYTLSISTIQEDKYYAKFLLKDLRFQTDGTKRYISEDFFQTLHSAFQEIGLTLSSKEISQ
jgi:DNA-directed RNA polymerase subunit F